MTAVAARYEEIKKLNTEVLAISCDSPFAHKVWQEGELSEMVDGGLPFPMLSDKAGEVGKVYGVYDEDEGVDIRGTFLIDPDGVIQAVEIYAASVGRSVDEMIRIVKAFQHNRKTGEVTPSGWQPGKKTLTPGEALAGKVCDVCSPDLAFDDS